MDNSVLARQIVEEAKKKDGVEIVECLLNQLNGMYVAEQSATIKSNDVDAKNYFKMHKPFLINAVKRLGKPCMGGYRLVLGYNPSENEIFIEEGDAQ